MSARGQGLQCIRYTKGQCRESHYIAIGKINEMVITMIDTAFQTGLFHIRTKNYVQEPDETTELNIEELVEKEQIKYRRIKEAYEAGVYTIEELKESRRMIDVHIANLRARETKPQNTEAELRRKLIDCHKDVTITLKNPSVSEQEKNELLRSFVDQIIFDRANCCVKIGFYI